MMYTTRYSSPVGQMMLASDGDHLIGLWLDGQKYHGDTLFAERTERDDLPVLGEAKEWLNRYFTGEKPQPSELPLRPIGSDFRQAVWQILCAIPYGEVVTYGSIAKQLTGKLGRSMSGQAVGGAVAHNPISVIIPCHRVVGSDGSLTGYAGGITTKIRLLEWEGVDMSRLFIPKKGTAL